MIDFTLSGKNVYKIYFVSKFKTEEYFIQASTEDEVMEFLIFECYIFGKGINRSNKSISELFDHLNRINKKYRKAFCFARGTYFYVKDLIKTDYVIKKKKPIPKRTLKDDRCILM